MNRRAWVLGTIAMGFAALASISLRSFSEAAFLGAYGARQMAWLPIANAAGFALATLGYDLLLRFAHAKRVDIGLYMALIVAAVAAPTLLARGFSPGLLVIALAATSQVAQLAMWNRLAASVAGRDARRMLPLSGASVTAGGAIAGLSAGALIPRLGMTYLPYLAAGVAVIVLAIALVQEAALAKGGAPGGFGVVAAGGPTTLSTMQRRLLSSLIAVAILEAVVGTALDLQFLEGVKHRYSGDDVAIALSLFYGGTNTALFVLQVIATPKLLVTRSLPFTASIHPAIVMAAYAAFAASPGFYAIAGTRSADQALRMSTARMAQELSLSALPPEPRARWKVRLRGGIWPLGAAMAGLVLLAIGLTQPERLALGAIAVTLVWFIAARVAARRFQTALAAPLSITGHRREDSRRIDLETLRRWTRAAGSEDAKVAALARAALARAHVDASDLGDHLRDDEPEVRAAMFEQLLRDRSAALQLGNELRAAIAIEDDDRALARGIEVLAIISDKTGITRGKERAGLSKEVDEAVRTIEAFGGSGQAVDVGRLCETRSEFFARTAWTSGDAAAVERSVLAAADVPVQRAGALMVIARAVRPATLPVLVAALEHGERGAIDAVANIDAEGAAHLAGALDQVPPLARAALARALAAAEHGGAVVAALIDDRDPEVAHAALRTALAVGSDIPAARIEAAREVALAALVAHLDARDASGAWSACARGELELATRRCVARLTWTAALEAASAGRDPAPIAAVARRLVGDAEIDRKRALDVAQELDTRADALAVIERWQRPAAKSGSAAALATFDPWLAQLGAGELAAAEPDLVALRRPALFASIAAPALAQLASHAQRRRVDGQLFAHGDPGNEMFVVTSGTLVAQRAGAPDRRVEVGEVVGELAVLTNAARAATVTADGTAEVLAIDHAAFSAAARRAPELVLGLASTLAGWLAPNRPDVL